MDVEHPKGLRLKRWQRKQLWIWRIGQRSESSRQAYARYRNRLAEARRAGLSKVEKKKLQRVAMLALSELYQTQTSYMKYSRRMERYARRGQLINGQLYCKAGKQITQSRVNQYEAMCHFMVRKFLPNLALWEAAFSYDDLVNQLRMEIYLALLNGFNPKTVMDERARSEEEFQDAIQKLEKTIVYGRLVSYLRRLTWKFHPDQFGGKTWCLEQIVNREDAYSEEFRYGLFTEEVDFPIDFISDQKDRLIEILNQYGPEVAKEVFSRLDKNSRDLIQDSLFGSVGSKWSELIDLEEGESCNLG